MIFKMAYLNDKQQRFVEQAWRIFFFLEEIFHFRGRPSACVRDFHKESNNYHL